MIRWCVAGDMNLLHIQLCMSYRGKNYSKFSSNSEANASELLENIEDMIPRYRL